MREMEFTIEDTEALKCRDGSGSDRRSPSDVLLLHDRARTRDER